MLFGTGGFIFDPHKRKVSLRMASFVAADSGVTGVLSVNHLCGSDCLWSDREANIIFKRQLTLVASADI